MHGNYRLNGGGDSDDNYKNGRNGDTGDDGHEKALIGADKSVGQHCYTCGKEGHWEEIVPKEGKMTEKEIVLKERAMSVAHMVIRRQIVGIFPKMRIKDPITGYQGKNAQIWPVHQLRMTWLMKFLWDILILEKLISARGSRK